MEEKNKDIIIKNSNLSDDKTEYIDLEEVSDYSSDNTVYIDSDHEDYDVTTSYIDAEYEENLLNDRYRILEVAGEGGMGIVYKAEDIRLKGSIVAIKQIKTDKLLGEEKDNLISTFENEASALIRLRHASIPRVLDYFVTTDMNCCIVMDYIEGNTIYDIVKNNGKMNEAEVLRYLDDISSVLTYLHSRNPKLIFRDLKPSNLMVDTDNKIKIIDFGIARNFDCMKDNDTSYYVSHGYSAPEQYGFGQSDERSDIYSLGCVLYFMLTSEKPQINLSNYMDNIEKLEISMGLKNAIISAMDYRADLRPQSIQEFMSIVTNSHDTNCNNENSEKDTSQKYDGKIINSNKKKGIRKAVILTTLFIILGVAVISKVSESMKKSDNGKSIYTKDQDENYVSDQEVSNISEDENIENAIEKLYEVTGASRDITEYKLNMDGSYIGTEEVKKNFYIFNIASVPSGDLADYNYAVKKSDLSVYYGDTYGMIIPYVDFMNQDSKLYKFLSDYWNYGQEGPGNKVQEEFKTLGAEKFLEKIEPILDESEEHTVDYYGGYVEYVNLILSGSDKVNLDQYVNGRIGISNNSPTYDMEELYKEYGQYGFEEDQIDSVFLDGWIEGFNYISAGNRQNKEDMEEYIYMNSPENVGGAIWTTGFWDGYNDYKQRE